VQSSGSKAFDALRDVLVANPSLRSELEASLDLNVRRVNPTDRANRFGSGAAVEWILAAVAYSAGILSIPGGHNANGFDLTDLRAQARGLWSVKNQTKRGEYRLTNGLGGGGAGFVEPTVFLSPALPGLVFVDPEVHPETAGMAIRKSDAVVLPFNAVEVHAKVLHPECVAACKMPTNPGTGIEDPWRNYIEDLLSADRFPQLSRLFVESRPPKGSFAGDLQALVAMKAKGEISPEQFDMLLNKLGS